MRKNGPVIPLRFTADGHSVIYDPHTPHVDATLFAFHEAPRVVPSLAHGSNAWRQFKLGVAAHRATDGVAEMVRYHAQCARAACARVLRADESGVDGAQLHVMRVEGLMRLGAGEAHDVTNTSAHEGATDSRNDSRAAEEHAADSAANTSAGGRQAHNESKSQREASRDIARIEERLRSIEALRRSSGHADTSAEGVDRAASSRKSGSVDHAVFRPSIASATFVTPDHPTQPSRRREAEPRVRTEAAVTVEQPQNPRPIVVNQDDADDAEIAALLETLTKRSGQMTDAQRRSLDAMRICSKVLDERTREARLSIAAVLLEAVTLKRIHQAVSNECVAHPRSALSKDIRELLQSRPHGSQV
jgi:hypothetical protein